MSRILIIEDEESIADLEKDYLELSGFEVQTETRGDSGLQTALNKDFDLIILDLMLPGVDGFEVCRKIRESKDVPILMVSAKKDDIDKIRGLGLGADDYMTKPFSPSELVARVKAHMARYERLVGANPRSNDIVEIRGLKIDKTARRVYIDGVEKNFTTKEFDLLTFLAENPNHVFSKEELFRRIWNMESVGDIATVTDGRTVTDPGTKVGPEDAVLFDGTAVTYEPYVYYMLHKPAGVISASEDRRERTCVDLIDETRRRDLFPVGRLDRDTEGLLLITNDGDLCHRLLTPSRHVDKVYYARISGKVTEEDVRGFASGLQVDTDFRAMPAQLRILRSDSVSEVEIVIREGKFHQIKRMFRAVGKEVLYLKRLSMGSLTLDPALEAGAWRRLTADELAELRKSL